MSNLEFSYVLPENFKKRTMQYLQQQNRELADSFRKCSYEYDDVGLAYYAGLKGDNWNKRALDFSLEGPQKDIEKLERLKRILEDAMSKALRSSESGFVLRKIYYFPLDDESELNLPESNEQRLSVNIVSAKNVLNDLIQVAERLCSNVDYNSSSLENKINDYFRDALSFKGYNEVKDQTRHGVSTTGKDAGEVDILLTKNGKEIAIFEGLKLDGVNSGYINEHIKKAIDNYNALGTATFVVAYVSVSNFESFWERYYKHLLSYKHPIECKRAIQELSFPNAATRIAFEILSKDGYDFPVYFLAIKIV